LALIVRLLVVRVEANSFTDQAASTRCSNSRCHWHALVCWWSPVGATLANSNVPPLAHPAVAGLIFGSALFS